MTAALTIAVWLSLGVSPQNALSPTAELTEAKALYAAGSYEEALTKLSGLTVDDGTADEADQYRALCLLALGRTTETEQSLEALVKRRPLFQMSEAEVSPRLITMFHAVRKRLLPEAARTTYVRAKRSFDEKDFTSAVREFRVLQQLLDDADMGPSAAGLSDLGLLADGFLRLAEAELSAAGPRPTPPPTTAAAAPSPTTSTAAAEPAIYSVADADVTPPVELSRRLPPWRPPNRILAAREYRGILRIVIDELGRVQAASLVAPIAEGYDSLLLSAARQWQFRPAMKSGVPVKYSRDIPIILSPVVR